MNEQTFLDTLSHSMQDAARQVRCSLGRLSLQTTREDALRQVAMLKVAEEDETIDLEMACEMTLRAVREEYTK